MRGEHGSPWHTRRVNPTLLNLLVVVAGLLVCWWVVRRAERQAQQSKERAERYWRQRLEHTPFADSDAH